MRGATSRKLTLSCFWIFQSTRPLRGATPTAGAQRQGTGISIHAPLAGRDVRGGCSLNWEFISIHAPLAGRDKERFITAGPPEFQSTRPLRGATGQDRTGVGGGLYFNPRAPCGARRVYPHAGDRAESISIHAPLAGRDRARPYRCRWRPLFQSTRPLRGATSLSALCPPPPGISIHAPLAGRDRCKHNLPHAPLDFNPRAPCGARRTAWTTSRPCANFNPRAPCGARLDRLLRVAIVAPISIHAPLAGRDRRAAPA